jgi:hypothetical protein
MSMKEKLAAFEDSDIYEEAARRIQALIEKTMGRKFTFGEAVFVFHNGQFYRIECKPSLRAYLKAGRIEAHV